jgi:hypothetical protein
MQQNRRRSSSNRGWKACTQNWFMKIEPKSFPVDDGSGPRLAFHRPASVEAVPSRDRRRPIPGPPERRYTRWPIHNCSQRSRTGRRA